MTQRTDTEMLDFLLSITASDEGAVSSVDFANRAGALQGALMCGKRGREAVSLAMGARTFEPGEPLPALTLVDRLLNEIGEAEQTFESVTEALERLRAAEPAEPSPQVELALDVELPVGSWVEVSESLREWEGFCPQMACLFPTPNRRPLQIDDVQGSQCLVEDWWIPQQYVVIQ